MLNNCQEIALQATCLENFMLGVAGAVQVQGGRTSAEEEPGWANGKPAAPCLHLEEHLDTKNMSHRSVGCLRGAFSCGWGIWSFCEKITQPLVLWTWMYQLSSWSLGWINSKRFFSGWNHSTVLNVNANAKKAEYWYIFQELHGHWATSLCPKILKFFINECILDLSPLSYEWTQMGEWNKGREGKGCESKDAKRLSQL